MQISGILKKKITVHCEIEGMLTTAIYQMLLGRGERGRKDKDRYGVRLWIWKEKHYEAITGRSATTTTVLGNSLTGLFLFNLTKEHPI